MVHKSTILIVDDLPAMAQLIATLLGGEGYRLEYAFSGVEALEKAEAIDPDMILLDVMMPEMDGFAVCRQLRAAPRLAEIPIIMITALDDRASRIAGLEAGADDFISKPFDQAELRSRVRAITRLNRYRRLIAERARYERLIELSPDGVFILDSAGQVRLVNPAMLRMLGADNEAEVLNLPAKAFVEPSYHENCQQVFEHRRDEPVHKRLVSRFVRRDGVSFPVEINAGCFEWDDAPMTQVVVRDITERIRTEEALRQRNQELAVLNRAGQRFISSLDLHEVLIAVLEEVGALFDAISAAVWLVDTATGELVCWRALGLERETLQGHRMAPNTGLAGWALGAGQTIAVADAQMDDRHVRYLDATVDSMHRSVLCVPFVVQSRAFGVLQLADAMPDRFNGADIGLVEALAAIAAMATENALLFRAVNDQRGQLRSLAGRLAEIQEQERQQLARELHDQIGQNLTVINLSMNMAEQSLPPDAPTAVYGHLQDAVDLIGQTAQRVRTVMAELRPPVLDDYGLAAALRWYGQQFSRRTGIAVDFGDCDLPARYLSTTETALFRIAQEALNNVAKHAMASQVVITLQCEDSKICLTIADNGQGFQVGAAPQASDDPHWGFLTMQERALAIGGVLHVTSLPGAGTTVVVEVSP
jgi:PAS domain S-box-containing protein